jgi:hypothetical protein
MLLIEKHRGKYKEKLQEKSSAAKGFSIARGHRLSMDAG